MIRLSVAAGIIGAVALSACGSGDDTAINGGGGGASGTDGGNATGGASAGASGGGNTSATGGGGSSTAGAGGTSAAGAGGSATAGAGGSGASTGGGSSSAGAGGGGDGGGSVGNGGSSGASGSSGNGGTSGDGGVTCTRGVECTGFSTTWVRGCTNDDSCVGEVHQTDCCGALRVMGMNHSEAGTFCPAEQNDCRPQYPTPPSCNSDRVVTDTGNTGSLDNVATRCADINGGVGTCTTYVCGTSGRPACPATRRIGTCG